MKKESQRGEAVRRSHPLPDANNSVAGSDVMHRAPRQSAGCHQTDRGGGTIIVVCCGAWSSPPARGSSPKNRGRPPTPLRNPLKREIGNGRKFTRLEKAGNFQFSGEWKSDLVNLFTSDRSVSSSGVTTPSIPRSRSGFPLSSPLFSSTLSQSPFPLT